MNPVRIDGRRVIAALVLFSVLVIFSACRASGSSKSPLLSRQAALAEINKFFGRPLKLKILSLTKFPSGPGYEVKEVSGPGYFVVDARAGEIDYAVVEEIKAKDGGVKRDLKRAGVIARAWAARHEIFRDFRYLEKQADYQWPKPGYYTAVWSGRPPERGPREFAKVTVDLTTGKIVSFGVGDPKWTMFCLPKRPGAAEN